MDFVVRVRLPNGDVNSLADDRLQLEDELGHEVSGELLGRRRNLAKREINS